MQQPTAISNLTGSKPAHTLRSRHGYLPAAAAPHYCMARSYRPTKKGNDNEKYENG